MNIQNAVRDTLAVGPRSEPVPAIVRIEPLVIAEIYQQEQERKDKSQAAAFLNKPAAAFGDTPVKMPSVRVGHLCRCCTVGTAIRDDYCYSCAIEHKEKTGKLKDMLRRCGKYLKRVDKYASPSALWPDGFDEHADIEALIAFIERECGE